MRNLLGLNVPKLVLAAHGPENSAATVQSRLLRCTDPEPESAAYFRFMTRVRERWQDRALDLETCDYAEPWGVAGNPASWYAFSILWHY